MSEPVATINFPPAWLEGKGWFIGPEVIIAGRLDDDSLAIAAGGVLIGGTNLLGFTFPGGTRFLRASPDNDWALEEHFEGEWPAEHAEPLSVVWRQIVESFVRGFAEVRAMGVL